MTFGARQHVYHVLGHQQTLLDHRVGRFGDETEIVLARWIALLNGAAWIVCALPIDSGARERTVGPSQLDQVGRCANRRGTQIPPGVRRERDGEFGHAYPCSLIAVIVELRDEY